MFGFAPQSFPAVVEIRGAALERCTATFVAPKVLVTAGRCVVAVNARGDPIPTSVEGAWAGPTTMFANLTVWSGAGTSEAAMRYVGRATNASWVYRSGVFGDNIAVLEVDPAPGATINYIGLRKTGFVFPESGAIVGFGSHLNVRPVGGVFQGAGTHRSGPAEVLEATEVFDYSGNCLKRKDGGALILQDYNTMQFPKACLASGDFGAALVIKELTGAKQFQLAGVAAQGDAFPCTAVRTYLSSVLFRQNWIQERVNAFQGNRFEVIVCASPSATPTAAPSVSASPSVSPTPSPSPSIIVEIVPPREIDWGIIVALGVIVVCLCCSACGVGVYYWIRLRRGLVTAVSPADVKDASLKARVQAKRDAEAPLAGEDPPARQPPNVATTDAERAERRQRAKDAKKGRNRKAVEAQRAKREWKRRAAKATHEDDRHVRVGATAASRFGGTGHGAFLEGAVVEREPSAGTAPARDSKAAPRAHGRHQKFQGTGIAVDGAAPMAPGPALGRLLV